MEKNKFNENKEAHGYWEFINNNGLIWFKTNFINGKQFGKCERYHFNGVLSYIGEYHNDVMVGYWEWYDEDGEVVEQRYYT